MLVKYPPHISTATGVEERGTGGYGNAENEGESKRPSGRAGKIMPVSVTLYTSGEDQQRNGTYGLPKSGMACRPPGQEGRRRLAVVEKHY